MAKIERRTFSCMADAIAARRAELFVGRQGPYRWQDDTGLQIDSIVSGGVIYIRDKINRQGDNERHIRLIIRRSDTLIVTLVYGPDGLLVRTF